MFSLIAVTGFLAAFELVLSCLGVLPLRETRDSFVGFELGAPLFVREGNQYVTNELKLSFFNKQSFPLGKALNTVRIFCLGGSTTYGRPYDDRTSYVGWLRTRLQETDAQRDWQVINCGGISYASYRLALLMQELINYEPDVIIIYTGHNEFLEDRTYGVLRDRNRFVAGLLKAATHFRIYTLIDSLLRRNASSLQSAARLSSEVNTILEHTNGPVTYHRDAELRASILQHFRDSLTRMCLMAKRAGAEVILVEPASNLRDFSPFKSEHGSVDFATLFRWDNLFSAANREREAGHQQRAAELFLEVVRTDPRHAAGLYFAGTTLLAAGRYDDALEYLVRAKDEDVCPLRALSEIQRIVAETAAANNAVLIDFPSQLAERCRRELGHAAVGAESFLDHVHLTIEVHRQLAETIAEKLADLGITAGGGKSPQISERISRKVLNEVGSREQSLALLNLAQVLSWAGKKKQALPLAAKAAQQLPKNSEVLSQYGRLLEKTGRTDEAFQKYQEAVKLNPYDSLALSRLARVHAGRGEYTKVRKLLQQAIRLTPERAPLSFRVNLHVKLGDCLVSLRQPNAAVNEYRHALRLDPRSERALQRLNRLLNSDRRGR